MHCCYIFKQDKIISKQHTRNFDLLIPNISVKVITYPENLLSNIIFKNKQKIIGKNYFVINGKSKSKNKLINKCIDYILKYILDTYGWRSYETEIVLVLDDDEETTYEILKILSDFNAIYTIQGEYNIKYENLFLAKGLSVRFKKQVPYDKRITVLIKKECEIIISEVAYDDIELIVNINNNYISDYEYSIICREFATRKDFELLFKNNYVKKMALKSKISNWQT